MMGVIREGGFKTRARCNWTQLLRCSCQRSFCLFVGFLAKLINTLDGGRFEIEGLGVFTVQEMEGVLRAEG